MHEHLVTLYEMGVVEEQVVQYSIAWIYYFHWIAFVKQQSLFMYLLYQLYSIQKGNL